MVQSIKEAQTLGQVVQLAKTNSKSESWNWLIGGAETESTLKRNRQSLDQLAFRPRVLRSVDNIDTTTKLFGKNSRLPIFLAPIGGLVQLNSMGSIAPAKAAKEFGVSCFVSSVSEPGMEPTIKQTGGNLIYQLYVRGDDTWVIDQLDRATDLGYSAFCITVDSAHYGRRERDKLSGYTPPARRTPKGARYQAQLNWELIKKIKSKTKLPIILKGIATVEDALISIDHEIDIIYISNHGGRQLDFGLGTTEVLTEIINTTKDHCEIYVDGGFYRGTDILKAICLGATAIGLGRLYGYGMAADGVDGIIRVLEILEEEIINAMANLGVTTLSELNKDLICKSEPVVEPTAFSAFLPVKISH